MRRLFTKTANELQAMMESETGKPSIETQTKYRTLQRISENIQKFDETIKDLILIKLDEEVLEKEIEAQFEYESKWNRIEAMFLERSRMISMPTVSEKRSFKLPKLQMITFDGQLKNWLPFWGQFQKNHEDSSLDETEKYQYLLQSTSIKEDSEVYVQVKSFSATAYQSCIDELRRLFILFMLEKIF